MGYGQRPREILHRRPNIRRIRRNASAKTGTEKIPKNIRKML